MTAVPLKYQSEIAKNACGLTKFKEYQKRVAYRWVFENPTDARNFLPVYELDKDRLKRDMAIGKYSCTCWAISFYRSEIQAKERFSELLNKNPKIYKKIGTHTAKGYLSTEDGISDDCDEKGHFNHFEYEEAHLDPNFSIVHCLISNPSIK